MPTPFGSLAPGGIPLDPNSPDVDTDALRRAYAALGTTCPARMVRGALGAVTLPGDVAQGQYALPQGSVSEADIERARMGQNDYLNRTADLAGLVTSGTAFAPAQRNAVGMGIRAYHGSPYDFDKFDISKIGTGEGAQAYGHGLYFAESEPVAQSYRETLAASRAKMPDVMTVLPQDTRKAIMAHADSDVDAMTAARRAQAMNAPLRKSPTEDVADWIEQVRDAKRGRMYEVNINASPDQFLDWDKPLSEQALNEQAVNSVLAKAPPMPSRPGVRQEPWTVQDLRDAGATGRGLYDQMSWATGRPSNLFPEISIKTPAEASAALREAGIPGIKYLDQGSRGAGMGTRNYVVFDPNIVDIVRKYGIAGLAALGAIRSSQGGKGGGT